MQGRLDAQQKYSRPAVFFHWVMLILVALAYLAIEIRGPKGSASRIFWTDTHEWAGVLVLALAVLRLLWRGFHGAPRALPQPPLLDFLARAVHVLLYVFVFAQPLLGILLVNFGGHPVSLAGLHWSFSLVSANPALGKLTQTIHVYLGNTFYGVIGLHALAALWHHFFLRDNTLRRML